MRAFTVWLAASALFVLVRTIVANMAQCDGLTDKPCCFVEGRLCRFLRDDGAEASRRWVCTLREQLGSWDRVHADVRYRRELAPVWRRLGIADCGDYPGPGVVCGECGKTG